MKNFNNLKEGYINALAQFLKSDYLKIFKKQLKKIVEQSKDPERFVFSNSPTKILGFDCALSAYILSLMYLNKELKGEFLIREYLTQNGFFHYLIEDLERNLFHDFGYFIFQIKKDKEKSYKEERRKNKKGFYNFKVEIYGEIERIAVEREDNNKEFINTLTRIYRPEEFYGVFLTRKLMNLERKSNFYTFQKDKKQGYYVIELVEKINREQLLHNKNNKKELYVITKV